MPFLPGKRDEARAGDSGTGDRTADGRAIRLVERMTDGFIALDSDWRIVYMNAAAMRAGEAVGPEAIGRVHWELWPETANTEVERQYRHAMETQEAVHFEHHYTKPGMDFWHVIHAYPDANGLSIFFRDITEQKRTRDLARLLADASPRLASTLDQDSLLHTVAEIGLPLLGDWACVYLVDASFRVTRVATAATTDRHLTLLRQTVSQLPLDATDTRLPWSASLHRGEPVLLPAPGDEFYAALGTPELRDFVSALAPRSLLCVPLLARDRVIGGITFGTSEARRPHDAQDAEAAREVALPAGLALDTARLYEEQRVAHRVAEEARREAESANTAKLDFIRAMSHELRTPLNAVSGYVQLLQLEVHSPLTAQQKRDLERIERNQEHVTGLINDVLQFARLEAGRIAFEEARVPVHTLLRDLGDYFAPQLVAGGHRLLVRECAPALAVHADAAKARQVLVNLIGNAFKHTPADSIVEVTVDDTSVPDQVRIRVSDTGPGIPLDQQASIFEPFVQIGRTLSHPVEGLGLGLPIARDLARGMGGDLTVESEPGRGTVFTLVLRRA